MARRLGSGRSVRLHRLKLVLLSVLAVGVIGSVTVKGVWAVLSSQSSGPGASIAAGSLTMENTNAGASASTTLSANVGGTTLSAGVTASATTITVSSAATFPASGSYTIQVDNEQMTVTGGQGTTTWTVTRGVNGTDASSHSSLAAVTQTSIGVASASGFPTSSRYTVLIGSEKLLVTAGQGTTTWRVTRGVDGTSISTHSSGATVATSACKSLDGSSNVNTACDSIFAYSPAAENYPGNAITSRVTITNTGSIDMRDLQVYMPSCLRGTTGDAPFAASAPAAPTFSGASSSGGYLNALTTYYYELTAVTASGESIAGAEASYTPPLGTNTNQITVNWTPVSGATSYKLYRSTTQGGELLLASGLTGTSYTDNTNTTPSGSPPSGAGSGNPCAMGAAQLYIQELNANGTDKACWYPVTTTTCSFDPTYDLGYFVLDHPTLGTALVLGAGPTSLQARYFKIGLQLPSTADNTLQGTEALFTLRWYSTA